MHGSNTPQGRPLVHPLDIGGTTGEIEMSDGGSRRCVVGSVNLPNLDKVGPAVGNGKVVLAKRRRGDGVGRAAAVGRGGQEQLLGDSAGLAVESKGRDVAGDAGRAGARRGEQVLGRRGAAVAGRNGDENLVGPVGGRVGEAYGQCQPLIRGVEAMQDSTYQ
jgi:hypothetical protein